jgi:hypothetical protein
LLKSEITIGVDTALNIALEAIDRLKITASSHQRAFLGLPIYASLPEKVSEMKNAGIPVKDGTESIRMTDEARGMRRGFLVQT